MVMYMRVIGSTIKLRAMVSTHIWMEHSTKVTGRKTNNMDVVQSHGLMVLAMRVTMSSAKSMATEDSNGLMDQYMWENLRTTI